MQERKSNRPLSSSTGSSPVWLYDAIGAMQMDPAHQNSTRHGRALPGSIRSRSNEFLLLDADDPAYEVFRPVGWSGPKIIITYVARPDEHLPANRFVYHADNSGQFPQRCSADVPIALAQPLIEPVSRNLDRLAIRSKADCVADCGSI
jgi:hypothetical protein